MKLHAGWATDVGRVRSGNEDSLLVDEHLGVFAVADGMGGHRGGEVASSTAIEAVRVALANGAAIDAAIRTANEAIRERAYGDPDVTGMGTTFTAIVPLDDANVLIGHVGDSRAYLVRHHELRKLTRDHSLVEDLVREGRITADQAEVHPQRSIITRALGIEPTVDVDLYTVRVGDGDRLLICSDGLTDMISERDVLRISDSEPASTDPNAPERTAHSLIDAANAAGGNDNITVVIIDVAEVGPVDAFVDHGSAFAPVDDERNQHPPNEHGELDALDNLDDVGSGLVTSATRPRPRFRRIGFRGLGLVARFGLAVLPIVLVASVAIAVVHRRATNTWFVSEADGSVVIARGVPGGIWWYDTEIVERTSIKTASLTEGDREKVAAGFCEQDSRREVRECVAELDANRVPNEPEPINPTSPTTSAPPTTTTRVTEPTTEPRR